MTPAGSCRALQRQVFPQNPDVFIAAAGDVDYHNVRGAQLGGAFYTFGDGVGGFQRGDDAFEMCELAEGVEGLLVVGGDGVGSGDLSGAVLQHIRVGALEGAAPRPGSFQNRARGLTRLLRNPISPKLW